MYTTNDPALTVLTSTQEPFTWVYVNTSIHNVTKCTVRDWSKSIGGWTGAEGGGSSVFEPLVRGGSFNFP